MERKLSLLELLQNAKTEELIEVIGKLGLTNEQIFEVFVARNIDIDDFNEHF